MSRAILLGLTLTLTGSVLAFSSLWRSLGLAGPYWILRLTVLAGWILTLAGAFRQARRARGLVRRAVLPLGALGLALAIPAAFNAARLPSHSLLVGGLERRYHVFLPEGGTPTTRSLPVLIVMHGFLQSWRGIRQLTGFERLARREGFLVVYPEGYRRSWNDGDGVKPASKRRVDDLGFLRALLDDVARRYPIDEGRVYAVGFSNSAFLLARHACALSDRLAAIGMAAGGVYPGWGPDCPDRRRMPAVFVNGTEDPALAPLNEEFDLAPLRSGELWAARNGCEPEGARRDSLPDPARDGTTVTRSEFTGCEQGAEVVEYRVEGGGHAWPGGPQYLPGFFIGKASRDFDASRAMWDFLRSHSLPAGSAPRAGSRADPPLPSVLAEPYALSLPDRGS
ncbi:MAG: alpha/beta hydrolase family esterase [Gemmatimonadota bacterium]